MFTLPLRAAGGTMSLEAVHVKEEPGCAVTDQELIRGCSCHPCGAPWDHTYAKTEYPPADECVKLEPSCAVSEGSCGVSEAAMLARLYTDHVVKEELVLGPESMQRRAPAVSRELLNVLDFERSVPCVASTSPDTPLADTTACVASRATDAGTSHPQPEFSDSRIYTQNDINKETLKIFLSEENDELPKRKRAKQLTRDRKFIEYFRLSREQFVKVLNLIESDIISKPSKTYPIPVTPVQKLVVTIRYLATGENLKLLSFQHGIPDTNLPEILKTTFQAICKRLEPIYLPQVTEDHLANVAKQFLSKWNFPNCCGALEGKRCLALCPENNGSLIHNCKQCPSVVFIALVDADGKFISVNIESGKQEDIAEIFSTSALEKPVKCGRFPFPTDAKLPGSDIYFPHFVIGGAGVKLLTRIMTPFCCRGETDLFRLKYNKRLRHPWSIVKSAFGILAETFRVFHNVIQLDTETVKYLILASCCLHNMLMENGPTVNSYTINHNNLMPLRNRGSNSPIPVRNLRNELKDYLCSPQGRNLKGETWESDGETLERRICQSHMCDTCGRTFTRERALKRHKNAHLSGKSYPCDTCKKEFASLIHLKSHRKTHVEIKRYTCDTCHKEFESLPCLINHRQKSHTGKRPFSCDICHKEFVSLIFLTNHSLKSHGVKLRTLGTRNGSHK